MSNKVTSIWEVNDFSSECFQAHCEPGEGGRSQSATSPPSASPCSQTEEQQDAPCRKHRSCKSGDRACRITAGPSGLSRHCTNIQDNEKVTEGTAQAVVLWLSEQRKGQGHQAHTR